jgi:hypothetical protein
MNRQRMTAQLPDKITVDGEVLSLYSNPLEQYWINGKRKKRPDFCLSEECKRGYIASWEIKDERLYLTKIDGTVRKWFFFTGTKTIPCSLKTVSSNWKNANRIEATWYTGKMRVPLGSMTRFDDHDYDSRFEKEMIITVEGGAVVKVAILDNMNQSLTIRGDSGNS